MQSHLPMLVSWKEINKLTFQTKIWVERQKDTS